MKKITFNILYLLILWVLPINVSSAEAQPSSTNKVNLAESFDSEKNLRMVWTVEAKELENSRWNMNEPIKLPLEKAIKIAALRFPGGNLDYVHFRRPLDSAADVFFYFFSIDDKQLVVLLDGTIVNPIETKE